MCAIAAWLSQHNRTGPLVNKLTPRCSRNLLNQTAFCTAAEHATNLASMVDNATHVRFLLLHEMTTLFREDISRCGFTLVKVTTLISIYISHQLPIMSLISEHIVCSAFEISENLRNSFPVLTSWVQLPAQLMSGCCS